MVALALWSHPAKLLHGLAFVVLLDRLYNGKLCLGVKLALGKVNNVCALCCRNVVDKVVDLTRMLVVHDLVRSMWEEVVGNTASLVALTLSALLIGSTIREFIDIAP